MTKLLTTNLSVHFDGIVALDNINLAVKAGEIRGIIGPNGAGKTTLVNLLTGVNAPTSGEILLDGQSILGLKASDIAARGVRRTFQTTQLFRGLSVLENVATGYHSAINTGPMAAAFSLPSSRRDEAEAMEHSWDSLKFVGMERFADRDGAELSFGQQRMVEIARAIVSRPQVILLDEPAVGLSLDRVYDLEALIKKIRDERGVTVLIIEHVIRLIMSLCDQITVLASGRMIADGTADMVSADPNVAEAYLGRSQNAVS